MYKFFTKILLLIFLAAFIGCVTSDKPGASSDPRTPAVKKQEPMDVDDYTLPPEPPIEEDDYTPPSDSELEDNSYNEPQDNQDTEVETDSEKDQDLDSDQDLDTEYQDEGQNSDDETYQE